MNEKFESFYDEAGAFMLPGRSAVLGLVAISDAYDPAAAGIAYERR
ncbi:MAG: hypothetical protein M9952_11845 [Microthrixaceae bacterium]|nr:hypothetical protein [Microthrixaceae bacterium]MCO5313613.1 hypothetical protein [Microthrixaceae bacterium]